MALWGSAWGFSFPWGGVDPGAAFACDLADDRVLVQHPDQPASRIFRDWICAYAEQAGEYLDVAGEVKDAFDIDTAVGAQLDLIGGMLDLPRSGFDDPRYRTLLNIKSKLLIGRLPGQPNWTGTVNNILSICREFIGVAVVLPVILQNSPPYSYVLSIPGITISELDILIRFLCKATWAAVLGQVIVIMGPDSLWDSTHGAVASSGIWCSAHGAVAGCAVWSHVVTIGDKPC